jgi:hypothetical protein
MRPIRCLSVLTRKLYIAKVRTMKKTVFISCLVFVVGCNGGPGRDQAVSPQIVSGTEGLRSAGMLSSALATPITGFAMQRPPGGASVDYPTEYKDNGSDLLPQLMQYLEETHPDEQTLFWDSVAVGSQCTRREAILMLTAQLAADLEAEDAIPFLVEELGRTVPDKDTMVGNCLIASLVRLTNIEGGHRFCRRWFDPNVQEQAVRDLRASIKDK